MNNSKRIKINEKPLKITYPIFLVIKKFGKDLGGHILSFLFQCDNCGDLEIGPIYRCSNCSLDKDMCRQCWDMKGLTCYNLPCFRCYYCNMYHCLNHTEYLMF